MSNCFTRLIEKKIDAKLRRLLTYFLKEKGKLMLALLCMTVSAASSSLIATLLGKLTDFGFYEREAWVLWAAPLGLVLIAVLHAGCMYASAYLLSKSSQLTLERIRSEMFSKMLRWKSAKYQDFSSGVFSARFLNEANGMLTKSAQAMVRLFRDFLQVIALLCLLIYYNWQLSLITFVTGPIIYLILKQISKRLKKVIKHNQEMIAYLMNTAQESYRAQGLIKIYNSYDQEHAKFLTLNERIKRLVMKSITIGSIASPLTQIVAMMGVAVVLTVALYQSQNGHISFGEFVTFLAAMLLLLPPLRSLAELNGTIATMSVAVNGIFSAMDVESEENTGDIVLEEVKGKIEFKDVSLTYSGSQTPSVRHFSFVVGEGEHVALVGASGSGKSSLINLILRYWEPTQGEILFDGKSYKSIDMKSLRRQFSVVSQHTFLFNESIRYNLTYGLGDIAEEKIHQALEAVSLTQFINSLPLGLDTVVGEAGGKLSGGQKQRLAIVRALLKDAPILILDEATSALDSESEKHFQEALEEVMKGRTCITVAHRLSTIKNSDRIVVMDQGEIKEIGNHETLMKKNGNYARLVKLQSLASYEKMELENV